MKHFQSIEDLTKYVHEVGCVTVSAAHIRKLYECGRLSSGVRSYIEKQLDAAKISHYPEVFPSSGWLTVRLVARDSIFETLIDACRQEAPMGDAIILKAGHNFNGMKNFRTFLEDALEKLKLFEAVQTSNEEGKPIFSDLEIEETTDEPTQPVEPSEEYEGDANPKRWRIPLKRTPVNSAES